MRGVLCPLSLRNNRCVRVLSACGVDVLACTWPYIALLVHSTISLYMSETPFSCEMSRKRPAEPDSSDSDMFNVTSHRARFFHPIQCHFTHMPMGSDCRAVLDAHMTLTLGTHEQEIAKALTKCKNLEVCSCFPHLITLP